MMLTGSEMKHDQAASFWFQNSIYLIGDCKCTDAKGEEGMDEKQESIGSSLW